VSIASTSKRAIEDPALKAESVEVIEKQSGVEKQ